jgi:DNA-binding MarR family transcriptional regulator
MVGKTSNEKSLISEALATVQQAACTNTALRRASRRLGQLYDEALAPTGLRATQVGLLTQIQVMTDADSGHGPTLQDLAVELALRVSGITHALSPLIRDSLVDVLPDPADARVKHALLTAKGRAKLSKAVQYWAIANDHVEKVVGSEKAAKLRELADQISLEPFDLLIKPKHGRSNG